MPGVAFQGLCGCLPTQLRPSLSLAMVQDSAVAANAVFTALIGCVSFSILSIVLFLVRPSYLRAQVCGFLRFKH